jgi:PAS domain S-box-containing protein
VAISVKAGLDSWTDGARKWIAMGTARIQERNGKWLVESGPRELELLLRAVLYHSSQPVLIADDDRNCLDASFGAGKLFGLSRDQIIARRIDQFVEPSFQPQMKRLWQAFLEQGGQDGTLPLVVSGGAAREVGYVASGRVLPVRHLLVLHDRTERKGSRGEPGREAYRVPSWVKDSALLLLDADGRVAAWYAGAERIYGYKSEEAIGQHLSFLCSNEGAQGAGLQGELTRAASGGRFGNEVWNQRKDGSRFWANVLTVALHDDQQQLRGFARVVRDFSDRHEADHRSRDSERAGQRTAQAAVVGIVSGEFDRVTDASDAFLAMVGYSHDDLVAGRPYWPDLTPPEYSLLEERAHEEGLIHGACAPFEKEYIRKDGTRVRVLVSGAVLSLSPYRWTAFVQDLTAREVEKIEGDAAIAGAFEGLVGDSAAMRRVAGQVEMVAPTDATVLILGETGTGKELAARAIHHLSARCERPFVTLNCAAIPTGLLESELFGYERGAFTGALSRKIGRFELANQGTLFLDEVGDIPLDLQPKLLRALQEKEFERLGGTRTIPIDVRLLAATNRNLTQMMGDKLFRSDLYYRLKVFPITVPPLRDHPEDIPLLARHFTQKYATQMKRKVETIPSETMRALLSWSWPGNVRELENFIERAVILSRGPDLRAPLAEIRADVTEPQSSSILEQVEREHILRVLRETGGVVSTAATRLGMPRTTLNAMMRKLGISRKDF